MKKLLFVLLGLALPIAGFGQELIEKIQIIGTERVTPDTINFYLTCREGDFYNEDVVKKDFQTLWSTGFFANIRIEQEQGARGRVIKIYLEENPVIRTISYKTGTKVKEDDIVNKLKEKDEFILAYSYFSPSKIQRIKKTIEEILADKGLYAAKVDVETSKKGKSEVEVLFKIDEGPKVRVAEVEFTGRPKLPPSVLRESMKENQKANLWTLITGKSLFKENKIADDLAGIKKAFQENGYMEATVGEPKYEQVTRRTFPFFKQKTMMKIIIPVDAGYIYRVGDVKIEGNKAFGTSGLMTLVKFKKGEVYKTTVREKTIKDMQEVLGNYGHLYGHVIPVENLDPKNKVVNLTYNIEEGEVCFLRRLDFKGNVFTKDKVIRREMLIREGDPLRLAFFKDSILRIKQLGLVDVEKDPDLKPDSNSPTQFDVTVNVKELQRNNIQFTAGYSGYEGTFIALTYSTVNFLGAGETLELTAQYGKRIKNYSFGFQEPYVFDKPITLGFTIYDRYVQYLYLYDRKDRGIDLSSGFRLPGYWRFNLTYSLQDINISSPTSGTSSDATASSSYYGGTSLYDYYYMSMFGWGNYYMSSIMPSLYRSTIDSPLTPSSGTMYMVSLKYAPTFFGGDIHLVKPTFQFTHYQPIVQGSQSIGFHIEYSYVQSLRNSMVPFWERYYLGGERNIRGYEIYTIGPRDSSGTNVGGMKSFVMNFEYILHVGGRDSPLYLIAFHDRGNSYPQDGKVSWKDMFSSTGLEARIFVPALRVPFRLIFSYNNRRIYTTDSNFTFRFAIGTTF
jgi:outer membrane protein insertion porin family